MPLLSLLLFATACGLSSDPVRMQSLNSPDGALVADYYQVWGGGATGGVADMVAIRRTEEPFGSWRDYVFGAIDGNEVTLKWIDSRTLEITYPKGLSPSRTSSSWHDVAVKYVARD
jgi:hypothetical protein